MPKHTLEEQVGQLLVMGFDGTEPTAKLLSMVSALQPGGVVLFARNIAEPRQTWELLRELRRCVRTPLFTCVDMEGGTVDRFKNVIGPAPSAADVFETGVRKLFRLHGYVIANEVRALGFNVDFAPVCDLALEPARKVLTSRAVSPDPKQATAYAREFLAGLKAAHVLGCGKHFPGLGGGALDTHKNIAPIDRTFKQLWNEDVVPYRELHEQMPFIMVSHAAYPAVDALPASLSKKWITDVLRRKLGYKGVIVSDDLEMGAAKEAAASRLDSSDAPTLVGEAALAHLQAGGDMYLVSRQEKNVISAFHAVLHHAEQNTRFAAQVRASTERVLALKKKAKLATRRCPAPTQAVMDKLRRELWELSEEVRLVKVSM
ncbi:MAG TPA: beta-N-acetylhexosaminidase [Terriglobales bacterium]|nr:beta-N-acetylhexosaminidase [Terriglobales bacterium]